MGARYKRQRENPSITDLVVLAALGIGGVWLLGWLGKTTDHGARLREINWDQPYRLGSPMHIRWRFVHKDPAEVVRLVFRVGEVPFYGQPIGVIIQELYKDVSLNNDADWQTYEIEHEWPLDNLPGRGFYTVANLILDNQGGQMDALLSVVNLAAV